MSIRVKWGTPKLDIFLATTLKNLDQKDARYLNQACLKFKLLMDFTHQASPHKSVSHCRQIDAHNSTIYIRTPTVFELKGNSYALSFYRSKNVFCRSKFFEPAQNFDCIQCLFKNFCADTKNNFTKCKPSFSLAQNVCHCHNT